MGDEIKLLNEKLDYLTEGSRRLHGLYDKSIEKNRNLQNKLDTCENETISLQSTLHQCQTGNQNGLISRKELESCRDEVTEEQNAKEVLNQNLKVMEHQNTDLRNQLASEKAENENLRNRIRQLENGMISLQSESGHRELANKIRDLTKENQNLKDRLDSCESNHSPNCKGPIVGKNGLSLLKTPSEIEICEDYGVYEKPKNSLLMFYYKARDGKDEKAVITYGLSSYLYTGDQFKIGNKDKIITSFNTNENVQYSLNRACGVIYQGLIHFFGGYNFKSNDDYESQHFGFDEKRNFVQYKNLEMGFSYPQCSTFKIVKPNSQSDGKEVVLLCFDFDHLKNCYQYDGELTHFADTSENHCQARLAKYKDQLITVGHQVVHQKTEILGRSNNGQYKWTIGPDYTFSPTGVIFEYSMVNVPKIGFSEEYLLLIGGLYSNDKRKTNPDVYSDKVHKYNGKWSFFGNLRKKRAYHGSVFLNGQVLTIGGIENWNDRWIETEIWVTSKSFFHTETSWPELHSWAYNLVFVVPDYTNL